MRRACLFLLILVLSVSLAAPPGAAFALSEEGADVDTALAESSDTASSIVLSPAEEEAVQVIDDESSFDSVPGEGTLEGRTEVIPMIEVEEPVLIYPSIVISEIQVDGKCDGGNWCTGEGDNVEFIELYNPTSQEVSLDGWKLRRQATGSTSQPADFVSFQRTGLFPGEYAVVATGLVESDTVAVIAHLPSNLSNSGGSLFLVAPNGEVIDLVGWGVSAKSYYDSPAVAPGVNQSIQRCIKDGIMFEVNPRSNAAEMHVYEDLGPTPGAGVACAEAPVVNICEGIVISEVAANVDDQFIELYNQSEGPVNLAGCRLLTNRSTSKAFVFPEETVLGAGEFISVPVSGTGLTVTKTTTGTVYIVSSDGLIEVDTAIYDSMSKGTSWAKIDGSWVQTYKLTPGAANHYEQYPPCEAGYFRNLDSGRCNKIVETIALIDCGEGRERNPDTGRCRNLPTAKDLAPCREGQYRSEETNRCRSIALTAASVLKPCADDQFRNPETNRCKKIASADDVTLADCGEGRERNPATNRCRNVAVLASGSKAPFPVEPTTDKESFNGWWVLGGLALAGVGYSAWEWRFEILAATKRLIRAR